MKTKEQRKAELLDALMEYWNTTDVVPHLTIQTCLFIWREIESENTLQKDPYADEVFGARVLRVIREYCGHNVNALRLSQCPDIRALIDCDRIRGFGYKSWQEYQEVMAKYGFTDKLN